MMYGDGTSKKSTATFTLIFSYNLKQHVDCMVSIFSFWLYGGYKQIIGASHVKFCLATDHNHN
jgi:hypothetical protein